jgi:viroplasmin and RNaseH domain-containing protein
MIFAVENISNDVKQEEIIKVKNEVHDLLNKRAALWNKLFSQKVELEEVNKELKKIVAPPLLTYDMEAFNEIKTKHTSMEKILKVDVLKVKGVSLEEEKIIVDIEVEWLMEGFEENYKQKVDYQMVLIKREDIWKISDYDVI